MSWIRLPERLTEPVSLEASDREQTNVSQSQAGTGDPVSDWELCPAALLGSSHLRAACSQPQEAAPGLPGKWTDSCLGAAICWDHPWLFCTHICPHTAPAWSFVSSFSFQGNHILVLHVLSESAAACALQPISGASRAGKQLREEAQKRQQRSWGSRSVAAQALLQVGASAWSRTWHLPGSLRGIPVPPSVESLQR